MPIRIITIAPGSPAALAGVKPDEYLLSINSEPIYDEIDYQALSTATQLMITVSDGTASRRITIKKHAWEPLGLCLDETEAMKARHCKNKCVFCFVDQLPCGLRDTLYVKDDDWRLSLMMGNYVTLTNVDDQEFSRILKRKASPLYISVHATDPAVRCSMMNNRHADSLMRRLELLKENGLSFHCQIVLCPGINDGEVLAKSIRDLASLFPAAQSLAIVPVGLTKFREKLVPLRMFDHQSAADLLDFLDPFQAEYLRQFGSRFVFPSDEFYCLSGRALPPDDDYEDYPQIENGVGMLRLLDEECRLAFEEIMEEEKARNPVYRHVAIPTGKSAAPYIREIVKQYGPSDIAFDVIPVKNTFFGESITVTGLLVGCDLFTQLQDINCDLILISATMLRENTECFLDDMTLSELSSKLNCPIRAVQNNGAALVRALWNLEDKDE